MEQMSGAAVFIALIQAAVPAIPALTVLIKSVGRLKNLDKKMDTCLRAVSMLLMHDEHLDLETRIAAGDDFTAAGGNGAGKIFHKELLRQYEEQLRERGTV